MARVRRAVWITAPLVVLVVSAVFIGMTPVLNYAQLGDGDIPVWVEDSPTWEIRLYEYWLPWHWGAETRCLAMCPM